MKKMNRFVCTVGIVLLLTGCSNKNYDQAGEVNATVPSYTEHIKDQLYYIPHEFGKNDFPSKYKTFLEDFPHLEVVDIENDPSENKNNGIDGVFVFTKLKEK